MLGWTINHVHVFALVVSYCGSANLQRQHIACDPFTALQQTDVRPWRLLPPQAKAGQAYDSAAQGAQQAKDYTQARHPPPSATSRCRLPK